MSSPAPGILKDRGSGAPVGVSKSPFAFRKLHFLLDRPENSVPKSHSHGDTSGKQKVDQKEGYFIGGIKHSEESVLGRTEAETRLESDLSLPVFALGREFVEPER